METIVVPNINVVKRGILIRYTTKLDGELGGVLAVRILNQSLALLIATIKVVDIPKMVITNLIMTIHVNRTTDLTHSQLLEGLKCESQTKSNGRIRSRGTLLGS